jgi:ATP-dependent DNA ligase
LHALQFDVHSVTGSAGHHGAPANPRYRFADDSKIGIRRQRRRILHGNSTTGLPSETPPMPSSSNSLKCSRNWSALNFRQSVAYSAECVVIKSAKGPYQPGKRGWVRIQFKREYLKQLADTFDLVVVGAVRGKGYRAGSYGPATGN